MFDSYTSNIILVRFILVSMSHIFISIYCYGFYFGFIGYIEFQFLIKIYFNFYVYKSKSNITYAVALIYSNLSPHCFPFSSLQGKFFSLRGQWPFFTVTTVDNCTFIKLINFLIAHNLDHLVGLLLPLEIQSQAFVFPPFDGWQGDSGPRGVLHKLECKTDRN